MQRATRGRRTIVGMAIGLTLLGLGTGPALGQADGTPTPPVAGTPAPPAHMDGMVGQCMRMMATMDGDVPGMMRPDKSAAPIMQR